MVKTKDSKTKRYVNLFVFILCDGPNIAVSDGGVKIETFLFQWTIEPHNLQLHFSANHKMGIYLVVHCLQNLSRFSFTNNRYTYMGLAHDSNLIFEPIIRNFYSPLCDLRCTQQKRRS